MIGRFTASIGALIAGLDHGQVEFGGDGGDEPRPVPVAVSMKFGWAVSVGGGISVEGFNRLVTFAQREAGRSPEGFGFLAKSALASVECIYILLSFGPRFRRSAIGTHQAV